MDDVMAGKSPTRARPRSSTINVAVREYDALIVADALDRLIRAEVYHGEPNEALRRVRDTLRRVNHDRSRFAS